jgi:hypothetical protein
MTRLNAFLNSLALVLVTGFGAAPPVRAQTAAQTTPHPILFVTQMPISLDFAAIGSVFANHRANIALSGRGGDLYIRYPDGSLRNLTREAGFGTAASFQGANAIAVRDPAVHWSGTKAVFSMVVGAPAQQYGRDDYRWQLYEVTGLGQGQTAVITRVPQQPPIYNNIQPTYGSDGAIIFASDRPRGGEAHLYPQLDEYESTPTVSGLWKLTPNGELKLLEHSPSGSFDPLVDSAGRVVFSRWDHLQRDQQNEGASNPYGTFNYSSESAASVRTTDRTEHFPEPRIAVAGSGVDGLRFNHFFPWQVNQDGTAALTLNHLGRHELHSFFNRSFTSDANLRDFIPSGGNSYRLLNLLHLAEDPTQAGRFYALNAPEFGTLSGGQIVRFNGAMGANPDQVQLQSVTHPDTGGTVSTANHSGHYRNPLPLTDGSVIASHAPATGTARELGTRANPSPSHLYRLTRLVAASNGAFTASATPLLGSSGIVRRIEYWDPDTRVTYEGPMWELGAVEVRPRPAPPQTAESLDSPELAAFSRAGVDLQAFRAFLRERNLGVVVMRDVTTRDRADRQQPFNLRVDGSGHQNPPNPAGTVYTIGHLQFLQGDQIRGLTLGGSTPRAGRRVLAVPMHDAAAVALNRASPGAPAGSVPIAADGSVAAFVPAGRALVWQTTSPGGQPVVRERYWLTMQPGEVRACDGCHGVNTLSHSGEPASVQVAEAFVALLDRWKAESTVAPPATIFRDGLERP